MLGIFDDPHRRHLALTVVVAVGLAAYLTGSVQALYGFDLALILALVGGFPIYLSALTALARRQISADLAVSLAAFAALYIGQYAVAAEVIFIMLIGETLEHFAIDRTRAGIAALLALRPQEARVRRRHAHGGSGELGVGSGEGCSWASHHEHEDPHGHDHEHGHEMVVPVNDIHKDDIVLVRPGDRIPVDGRVIAGSSSVDQSPITGESLPADKNPGDEVFAGTINLHGAMELAVERLGEDTTLEQIIHLVEHAEAAKAPTQRLADRYATWFVPIVLVAAAVTWYFTRDVVRSVAVLVVACPCALVLATPTAIAAGVGSLVRRGVLVKGGNVLETLARVRTVVFDKTGTLTLARLRLAEIVPVPGRSESEILRLAAAVERQSEHPIGRLIADEAASRQVPAAEATGFLAHPGLGAEALVEGQAARVGSPRFLQQSGVTISPELQAEVNRLIQGGSTVVLVARASEAVGAIAVQDTVRGEARQTIDALRALGIQRIVMLTGDNVAAAQNVAKALGIDDARSGLLPTDKVEAVRQIQKEAAPVAMVGDGINDAPSLVTADVGVAMAQIGSDVTIASAGLILVGDDLRKLVDAITCGRAMLRIIWQNILGAALVFNLIAVAAASMGFISPVVAAVVHQVSSLAVVVNSLRLLVDVRRLAAWFMDLREAIHVRRRRLLAGMAAAAVLAYLASGLHVVEIGEVAVVQRFGKFLGPPEPPGLHYRLPYPLGRHQRVNPDQVRRVEIGFRNLPGDFIEPPAYEWNVQHRGGRYVAQTDEATVWAGDESLADVNLVIQYRVAEPLKALFGIGPTLADGTSKWDALVRALAESALHAEMSRRVADTILGSERAGIEADVLKRLAQSLAACNTGLVVECVCLGDVHPPLEVVPAFREVASALEEKEAMINEANAYQLETNALAAGQAEEKVRAAEASREDRVEKATGQAARFIAVAAAYGAATEVTRLRLYLQTIEIALAGRRKVILDHAPAGARRQLFLGPQGVWNLLPPAATPNSPTAAYNNTQPQIPATPTPDDTPPQF